MLQIAFRNEKVDTILSQANAPENLRQPIASIHSGFQPLSSTIAKSMIISK